MVVEARAGGAAGWSPRAKLRERRVATGLGEPSLVTDYKKSDGGKLEYSSM